MACWIAGSLASGATVATYRSVLATWLRVQTATTDSAFSARSRSSSARSSPVRAGPSHAMTSPRSLADPGRLSHGRSRYITLQG